MRGLNLDQLSTFVEVIERRCRFRLIGILEAVGASMAAGSTAC